jgi:hypothetical protein
MQDWEANVRVRGNYILDFASGGKQHGEADKAKEADE